VFIHTHRPVFPQILSTFFAMRVVVQRVSQASVTVDKAITGKIGRGLLLLVAFHTTDTFEELHWMAEKVLKLRIFPDEDQKMNRSVQDVHGSLLVVSQFTLYGDARKGTRPSFVDSARPEIAIPLYEKWIEMLKKGGIQVETGIFGAMMQVALVNDGPVTLILDRDHKAAL
jgi:D-tyrosyl-tRNA(Tyr) deacylase